MKSWKESNVLKESSNKRFEYDVLINGGYIRIVKKNEMDDFKYTTKTFITKSDGNLIDKAIRLDPDVNKGRGLAEYVDDIYQDNIDSILYKGIKEGEIRLNSNSYSFKPIVCFKVTGTIPEEVPLEGFKNYIKDFIEGQCSDGWGEGFEQQALPTKPRTDHFGYPIPTKQWKHFSPWSNDSEVWIREK